jgi:hypothetical protein
VFSTNYGVMNGQLASVIRPMTRSPISGLYLITGQRTSRTSAYPTIGETMAYLVRRALTVTSLFTRSTIPATDAITSSSSTYVP